MAVRDDRTGELRSDGELPAARGVTPDLQQLHRTWRDAVGRRSARGELRASREECDALERFITAGGVAESAEHAVDVCACGHPIAHHDESGSCFHVVGCATGCGCDMLIRKATEWDAHQIIGCLHEAFAPFREQYTADAFHDTVLDHDSVVERLRTMSTFVAISDEGDVIGTVACGRMEGGEAHIRGMAVRPQWQGRGIAERLLSIAENEARSLGCGLITLGTTKALERATRFYQKHGYRQTAVDDFFGMPLYEFEKVITSD